MRVTLRLLNFVGEKQSQDAIIAPVKVVRIDFGRRIVGQGEPQLAKLPERFSLLEPPGDLPRDNYKKNCWQ